MKRRVRVSAGQVRLTLETAPAGFGTSGGLVNMVTQAYPGATSEAINYPACGGQSQCGGVSVSISPVPTPQFIAVDAC